jgi:hypothetical protein
MTEKQVTVKEALQWTADSIHETLDGLWTKHCQSYDFDCDEDYAPYGDTYVSTGSYITDESDEKCREYFENNYDANAIIDELKTDTNFKECLNELVKAWAWQKELEV